MSDWHSTTLQEIISTIESGSRPKGGVRIGDNSEGVPSYGGENISMNGGMLYESVRMVPTNFATEMRRGVLSDRDVLINKDGANTGKSAIYRKPAGEEFATINEHLFILRCNEGIADQEFLYHFLNSELGKSQIARVITGSAQPGLNSTFPEFVRIHLPPLPEQKKIAEILSGIKNFAYAKRIKVSKEKDLMESMRNNFFSASPYASSDLIGRTKWDEGSRISALKDICSVRQGLQIPISERSKSRADGMLPYLTVAWINSGFSIIKAEYIKAPRSSVVLKEDEFVVARTGAVGKVFGGIKCVFHNNFFAVKTHPGTLPDYVKHYLKWGAIQREMLDRAGTTSIPDLNHGDFYAIKIPLPSLDRQKFIVRMLSCLEKKIDCLKREIEALDTLFDGVSADLLSGHKRVICNTRVLEGVGL